MTLIGFQTIDKQQVQVNPEAVSCLLGLMHGNDAITRIILLNGGSFAVDQPITEVRSRFLEEGR